MPTTRTRRTREARPGLTAPEKHLLLTGKPYPPKGSWTDYGEKWLRPHLLLHRHPHFQAELRALWLLHREELLAEWKEQGKEGLPWAEKKFNDTLRRKDNDQ